jgi:hypothetical protein
MTMERYSVSKKNDRRTAGFVAVIAALFVLGQQAVFAAPTPTLAGGRTSVELSADFLGALTTLNVTPGRIKPGKLRGTTVSFPISAGALDLETARGEIHHTGGLTLTAGTTEVQLLNFTIDTSGDQAVLTGVVTANGSFVGRLPLFDLALPALTLPIQPQGNAVVIPNVGVTLSDEAASALNGVFGVTAFAGGFNIGTATVDARAGTPKANK